MTEKSAVESFAITPVEYDISFSQAEKLVVRRR